MSDDEFPDDAIHIEIDGTLDLHHFSPKDLFSLLPEYFLECKKREIYALRLIHGKGVGHLRRSVHAILDRSDQVHSYSLGDESSGGWGATLVNLKR